MGDSVDELEQYSRRNCLMLHDVRELECKNTIDVIIKTIKEEMDIDTWEKDLDWTHRIGNPKKVSKKGRPRPHNFQIYFLMICIVQETKIKINWKIKTFWLQEI